MNLVKPTNPTYALTVSYRIDTTVVRYLLWDVAGGTLGETIPAYQGQLLGKNLRFEAWDAQGQGTIIHDEISMFTSKLGDKDYRYGDDFALATPNDVVTNFNCPITIPSVSAPTSGLLAQFRSDFGVSAGLWAPKVNNCAHSTSGFTFSSGPFTATDALIGNRQVILLPPTNTNFGVGQLTNFANQLTILVVFRADSFGQMQTVVGVNSSLDAGALYTLAQVTSDMGAGESSGQYQVANFATPIANPSDAFNSGSWMLGILTVIPSLTAAIGRVYEISGTVPTGPIGYNLGDNVQPAILMNNITLSSWFNSAATAVAEVLVYDASTFTQAHLNYVWDQYKTRWNFPLTFPSNSVSVTN